MFRRILITSMLVLLSTVSQAALFDRGGGMIYDDVLNITWLQDASAGAGSAFDDGANTTDGRMTWDNAVAWADDLSYGGFDDWRLPSMDVNGDHMAIGDSDNGIVDCSTASEMACRDNELGYMFYQNLMGSSGDNLSGDQGLFTNIGQQWSGTEWAPNPAAQWYFRFNNGGQLYQSGLNVNTAWAVRPGDVAVIPLPAGIWLLGSAVLGVAGMGSRGRRRR